ncbi:MAG: hypothetical protein M2R45_00460 [Verrucomicrobia subdivision 3 bacterium]|nr:hypothetical protein [Limisphaerales bacterium]MCS1413660.1 hypothetical protein [Limisphaerales bacterium]
MPQTAFRPEPIIPPFSQSPARAKSSPPSARPAMCRSRLGQTDGVRCGDCQSFGFRANGGLASLTVPLADAGIPVFGPFESRLASRHGLGVIKFSGSSAIVLKYDLRLQIGPTSWTAAQFLEHVGHVVNLDNRKMGIKPFQSREIRQYIATPGTSHSRGLGLNLPVAGRSLSSSLGT